MKFKMHSWPSYESVTSTFPTQTKVRPCRSGCRRAYEAVVAQAASQNL